MVRSGRLTLASGSSLRIDRSPRRSISRRTSTTQDRELRRSPARDDGLVVNRDRNATLRFQYGYVDPFTWLRPSISVGKLRAACGQFSEVMSQRSSTGLRGHASSLRRVAPRAGFEPATLRLTAGCSAVELPRNEAGVRPAAWAAGL